jgi:inorganic pyrophosphatase
MNVYIEKEAGISYVLSTGETWTPAYPYGYIIGTKAVDGGELDCFVITDAPLVAGSVVECHTIGLMEQLDNGVDDHNILVALDGEDVVVTDAVEQRLLDCFSNVQGIRAAGEVQVGRFLDADEAEALIVKSIV